MSNRFVVQASALSSRVCWVSHLPTFQVHSDHTLEHQRRDPSVFPQISAEVACWFLLAQHVLVCYVAALAPIFFIPVPPAALTCKTQVLILNLTLIGFSWIKKKKKSLDAGFGVHSLCLLLQSPKSGQIKIRLHLYHQV